MKRRSYSLFEETSRCHVHTLCASAINVYTQLAARSSLLSAPKGVLGRRVEQRLEGSEGQALACYYLSRLSESFLGKGKTKCKNRPATCAVPDRPQAHLASTYPEAVHINLHLHDSATWRPALS